jgi:hypothetical protein
VKPAIPDWERNRKPSGWEYVIAVILWLVFVILLFVSHTARGQVVILQDTATVTRFDWAGTNAQFSTNLQHWTDYDSSVYSKPLAVSGNNALAGYVRGCGVTNWIETVTNTVQPLHVIGSAYLKRWRETNGPPPIPE